LPGFGQVKVKRIKDTFEKPFRNKATSATFSLGTQVLSAQKAATAPTTDDEIPPASTNAGVNGQGMSLPASPSYRPPSEPNPMWDIELDLDSPTTMFNGPEKTQAYATVPEGRPRSPSPVWDIELDLNEPDDDLDHRTKEPLASGETNLFGAPKDLL